MIRDLLCSVKLLNFLFKPLDALVEVLDRFSCWLSQRTNILESGVNTVVVSLATEI